MNTAEFRLGNRLEFRQNSFTVFAIIPDFIAMFTDPYKFVPISEVKPIALSEKWLIMLGFELEESEQVYYYQSTGMEIHINDGPSYSLYAGSSIAWVEVKYVHQLQNIHYSLTNQELSIVNEKS